MTADQRSPVRATGWLVGASILSGLTAYVFAVVAARHLQPQGFARVSVLWSFWAISVALFGFPLQHWIASRGARDSGYHNLRSLRFRIAALALGQAVVLAAVGSVERFFSGELVWSAMVAIVALGAAVTGSVRGALTYEERYGDLAIVVAGENLVRVAFLLGVVAVGGGPELVGWCIAVGPLVVLPFVRAARPLLSGTGPPGDPAGLLGQLIAVGGATALAQAAVQIAPAATALLGQSAQRIAAAFTTFAVARAPILVFLSVSGRLTTPLTRRLASGQVDRLRRGIRIIDLAAFFTAGVAGVLAYWKGPELVEFIFGPGLAWTKAETAIVAVGAVIAVVNFFHIVLSVAAGHAHRALATWAVAAGVGVAVLVALRSANAAVAVAFLVTELVAYIGSRRMAKTALAGVV